MFLFYTESWVNPRHPFVIILFYSIGDVEVGPLGLDLNTFNMRHLARSKMREKLLHPTTYFFGTFRLVE